MKKSFLILMCIILTFIMTGCSQKCAVCETELAELAEGEKYDRIVNASGDWVAVCRDCYEETDPWSRVRVIYSEDGEIEAETTMPMGWYSLEECKEEQGFYVSYNDGTFDRYTSAGYCQGKTTGVTGFYGMFLADSVIEELPEINNDTNLVLFYDADYSLQLFPIHAEISTISLERADGTKGYGYIDSGWELSDSAWMTVYYRDNDWERVEIQTIDGNLPAEYDMEIVSYKVNPYPGMTSVENRIELVGLKKGTVVQIGVGSGTSLVEKSYNVDTTYFDCASDHNNWEEEDVYRLYPIPTTSGYAKIDFTEIPNGKYAMVLSSGSSYYATFVNINR